MKEDLSLGHLGGDGVVAIIVIVVVAVVMLLFECICFLLLLFYCFLANRKSPAIRGT